MSPVSTWPLMSGLIRLRSGIRRQRKVSDSAFAMTAVAVAIQNRLRVLMVVPHQRWLLHLGRISTVGEQAPTSATSSEVTVRDKAVFCIDNLRFQLWFDRSRAS